MRRSFVAVTLLASLVLVSGCNLFKPHQDLRRKVGKQITFEASGKNGVKYEMTETEKPVVEVFDPRNLYANAQECGHGGSEEYFKDLMSGYGEVPATIYDFRYDGRGQEPMNYTVTVVPNLLGFTSLVQLKENFDFCGAGGSMYPVAITEKLFMFKSSCGSGFDDGSGLPVGCQEIEQMLDPQLNQ